VALRSVHSCRTGSHPRTEDSDMPWSARCGRGSQKAHNNDTTTKTRSRKNARYRILSLTLGICALAIPASASASSGDDHSSLNSITGGSSESSQPATSSGYSSVNSITPPATEPSSPSGSGGSPTVDSGYSSLNAITGPSASEPTVVSGPPADPADGFDWASAAIGAGAAMALVALGGAATLTVRRRTAVSPSGTSMS
jgi:hypothetical protein